MYQKNETPILILALLTTLSLVGAGCWWFMNQSGTKTNNAVNQPSNTTTFAQIKNVPNGLFNYGGSTTWATIRRDLDLVIQSVWPQFRLRYMQPNIDIPSSGTGISMLLDNQLSFTQSSRSIQDKEQEKANQKGFTLKEIPVAIDAFAVAVNPSLNIPGLTIAQLNDIFAGKITNWNQVGGPNLKIKPYAKGTQETNRPIKFVPTTTEALRQVAAEPGAIFQASAPLLVPQCTIKTVPLGRSLNQLIPPYKLPLIPLSECPHKRNQMNKEAFVSGEYPLTRRLFVVVKKDGQLDEQAGEAYANLILTDQGQALIEQAGFVRIR